MLRQTYLFIILSVLGMQVAWSQQVAQVDTLFMRNLQINEVVIQAFKQHQDLKVAPVAASTLTGTAIKNRNALNIKELSSFVPNLFMPDYGSKLTSPVFIRGIGSKINSPSVGLYVDGIPYFEKSAFDFDFSEIARMEVLRGPQGTLYGRNTMGGIINIYTKSPLRYEGTTLGASLGNYMQQNYNVSHYRKLGEKFGIAISGNYNQTDGFFTNQYTGEKADDSQSGSARIRLEWQPKEHFSFGLTSTYDWTNQGGYPYAVCDPETLRPGEVNYNDYSFYKRSISTTGLSVKWDGKGYSIQNQMAFQYISDHQGIDQDFTPKSTYFARQDMKQKMFSEEFNIKSTTNTRYKWLFGAFGFWQGVDNTVPMDYLAKGYTTLKQYDIPTYGAALYHQSTLDDLFVKGLSFTFGLRYDCEKASNDYIYHKITNGNQELVEQFKSDLIFSQLTPKFTLEYIFPSSGLVYASVTKGYKTGGFNTSFEQEEDRTFEPETSWNYEIGTKHPFVDKRFSAEFALFWIDWRNQQIYQMLATQNGQLLRNAGKSVSKGVEISLQGNPVNGLMFQLNYGYTHATFKKYEDERKGINYNGNYLPLVPKHTLAMVVDYTIFHPCSLIERLTFSANFTQTGPIYWKEDNRKKQDSYRLLNGKISASKGIVTLALWAKNITNTHYNSYYFESGGNGLAQAGRPFTLGGNIQIQF